jgi:hypothetical protein
LLFLLRPSRSHSSTIAPLPKRTNHLDSKGNHSILSAIGPIDRLALRFSSLNLRFLHFQLLVTPLIADVAAAHLEVVLLTIDQCAIEIPPRSFPIGRYQAFLIILFLRRGRLQHATPLITLVAITAVCLVCSSQRVVLPSFDSSLFFFVEISIFVLHILNHLHFLRSLERSPLKNRSFISSFKDLRSAASVENRNPLVETWRFSACGSQEIRIDRFDPSCFYKLIKNK